MIKRLPVLVFAFSAAFAGFGARQTVDFENYTAGYEFKVTGSDATTAIVCNNPYGSGKVLKIEAKGWNQVPEIPVTLPSGISLGDCSAISAQMYIPSSSDQYVNWKQTHIYIDGTLVFKDTDDQGNDTYPFLGEKDQWFVKTYDTSWMTLTEQEKELDSFRLGIGINNDNITYYLKDISISYDLNLSAPVLPAQGAFYTGKYRNLFEEAGYDDSMVQTRIDNLWQTYFEGNDDTERLYYPVGSDMAYILDVNNNDVRSEGMSYGLMICVQMDKQKEFNALWKWAKTYMQFPDTDINRSGYFAWQCDRNGGKKDNNTASDGEEYFIMALMFASHRWGDGEGIYNYGAEAEKILNLAINRPKQNPWDEYYPLFNHEQMQVVFVPFASASKFTDPSYHLPAFYELWGRWSEDPEIKKFCSGLAAKSREMWPKFANATTGLMPDYADFDGSPHNGDGDHAGFYYDAWRCIANMAIDYAWFKPEGNPYEELVGKLYNFFLSKGITDYHSLYQLNGNDVNGNTDHSPGLVACNASGALASGSKNAWKFIDNFVDTAIPTGKFRYYDGCLYFLNWLNCAGRYRIYDKSNVITSVERVNYTDAAKTVVNKGGMLKVNTAENSSYTIISLQSGIVMATGTVAGDIDCTGYPHGIYTLMLQTPEGVVSTDKIIL